MYGTLRYYGRRGAHDHERVGIQLGCGHRSHDRKHLSHPPDSQRLENQSVESGAGTSENGDDLQIRPFGPDESAGGDGAGGVVTHGSLIFRPVPNIAL
jgi:hypothetical protein